MLNMRILLAVVFCCLLSVNCGIQPASDDKENVQRGAQPAHQTEPEETVILKKIGEHGTPIEGGITELDYSISGTDFYTNFIRKRTPLIFRGVAKSWKAVKHWHDEDYMRNKYGHVLMDVEMGKVYKNELNPRETMNISAFLDVYKEKSVYLDSPFPQSELINDLEVPFFMQCPELAPNFTSAHLLFSSGNTSSCVHQDGYENLLTMVSGIKVVVLVNYTYMEEVYAENIDTFPGLSPISPEAVDFKKWPLFKDVPFHKITLHPGDIVYIPKNWWHHVRSFQSPNIGVSIWFNTFINETEPNDDEELIGIRDVIKQENSFAKLVDAAAESIECPTQNIPMSEVVQFKDQWQVPDEKHLEVRKKMLKNGYELPMIGFGTAGLFENTEELVGVALSEGYRLIDSAQAYNETAVGNAIQASDINRQEVFIVSKVHPKNLGYESTIISVEKSLTDLQTDFIDLMLIHSKDCDEGPDALLVCGDGEPKGTWTDTWKALEDLVSKGKIRSIGVSNFEVADLKELQTLASINLSVVQNWFDPFNRDDSVRDWCKENGVAYMGHSTLGESWVREGFAYNPVLADKQLQKISHKSDADVPRVIIRWAIDNDVIVIPRSSNPLHIGTNLQIHNIILERADLEYINSLNNALNQDVASSVEGKFVYSNVVYEEVMFDRPIVYVSSDDHWIYAFDAGTGRIMWKTETADETGSSCAFSLSERVIFCGADDSYVRALHASNGTIVWRFKTGSSVTSSSHVTADGTLVIGSHDSFLYALHSDGTLRWKFKTTGAIWSSPVTNSNGNIAYIASYAEMGKNIHAIDMKTGSPVWEFEGPGGFISSPVLSPDESIVLFCSGYGSVFALDPWTGELAWKAQFDGPIESTPVFARNSRVFIPTHDGYLVALDSRNGKILWNKQVSVNITSSPAFGPEGQMFIGGGDGELIALKQKTGEKIWTQKVGSFIFFSSPRLSKNGILYIGSADTPGPLLAVNTEDGEIIWKTDTNGPIVGTPLLTKHYAAKYD